MNDQRANASPACPECGAASQGESFCDSCGAPLRDQRLSGEREQAAAGPAGPGSIAAALNPGAVVPPERPVAQRPAPQQPVPQRPVPQQPVPREPAPAAGPPAASAPAAPRPAPVSAPAGSARPPMPGAAPHAGPPVDDTLRLPPASASADVAVTGTRPVERYEDQAAADRARALLVPVADPRGRQDTGRVVPVLPGMPTPQPPAVRGQRDMSRLVGVPCPWCSTPNPMDRHFCQRCALPLGDQPISPRRRPWWRRMLDWRHREPPYAGQRPRLRRGTGRLVRYGVWGVVIAALVVLGLREAKPATMTVEDHFMHPVSTGPSGMTASREDPRHPVADLHDDYNNTWWGSGLTGDAAGVHLDATFDQPVDLLDVVITSGAGTQPDVFAGESRPQAIDLTLYRADGTTSTSHVTLADTPGPQVFAVRGDDVTHVRFTIESSYNAAASPSTEVAIAEIEFDVRNSARS